MLIDIKMTKARGDVATDTHLPTQRNVLVFLFCLELPNNGFVFAPATEQ